MTDIASGTIVLARQSKPVVCIEARKSDSENLSDVKELCWKASAAQL